MTAQPRPEPHPPTGAEARLLHDRLATLDLLCSRDLDAEHGGSGPGAFGPGYRIAELERETAASVRDGLLGPLTKRWGAPVRRVLDGPSGDEPVPEPWAFLGTLVTEADVWRTDDRWLALGVTRDRPARLLALVTSIVPP